MFSLFDQLYQPEFEEDPYSYYRPRRVRREEPDPFSYFADPYAGSRPRTVAQPQRRQQRTARRPVPDDSSRGFVSYKAPQEVREPANAPAKAAPPVYERASESVDKNAPSEDSAEPRRITNRESADPPEVAFRTYRRENVVSEKRQVLTPLSESAKGYLSVSADSARIVVPFASCPNAPHVEADGNGVLSVSFTSQRGEQTRLQYQLPPYYERQEIEAARTEDGFQVTVPLRSNAEDDVMLIQI